MADVTTADLAQEAPAVPRRPMAGPPIVALVCSAGGLQALTHPAGV